MQFLKKHGFTIIVCVFIVLLIFPQTSLPVKVFFQRIFMGSPSMLAAGERTQVSDYDWRIYDLEGDEINFNRSEESLVLLNFWATWCPPCVAELPSLQQLYNTYGNKVDFYLLTAEEPEVVSSFLKKRGFDFPVYIQRFKGPDELEVQSIPTTYLIDKNGVILIEKTGAADWNSEKFRDQLDLLLP